MRSHSIICRCVGGILLSGIFFCFMACSTMYQIPVHEVSTRPDTTYSAVIFPATISGVVYADTSKVAFDSSGGSLDRSMDIIRGLSEAGDSITVRIDELLYLQMRRTNIIDVFMKPKDFLNSLKMSDNPITKKFKRGRDPFWNVIALGGGGMVYNAKSRSFANVTKKGTWVTLPLEEVRYAQYRKRNYYKTSRLVIGLAGAVLTTHGIIQMLDL